MDEEVVNSFSGSEGELTSVNTKFMLQQSEEKSLWNYIEALMPDQYKARRGRLFGDFTPKSSDFWIQFAIGQKNYPQLIIQGLFEDLKKFPAFNLEAAKKILSIQKILRAQFESLLILRFGNNNSLINQHKESLIRSYVYAVISAERKKYFDTNNVNLIGDALKELSMLESRMAEGFLALSELLDKSPDKIEKLDEQSLLEEVTRKPGEYIWSRFFEPYINVYVPEKKAKKYSQDTDESTLLQGILAVLGSSEFSNIGLEKSIEGIMVELKKPENAQKKKSVEEACKNLAREQKQVFGKSKAAKKLTESTKEGKKLREFFSALNQKIVLNSSAQKRMEPLQEEGTEVESESDSDSESASESREEILVIKKRVLQLDKSGKNRSLMQLWTEAWAGNKPKTSLGKFIKTIGSTSAKKNITDVFSSPISKVRYEKVSHLIQNLTLGGDYTGLYKSMQEFMGGWFINSANLPRRCYQQLKRFQMTLDDFAYDEYILNKRVQSAFQPQEKKSKLMVSEEEKSTESISLSTPRVQEPVREEIEKKLIAIKASVEVFLANSRNFQKGRQKHTGLKAIENFLNNYRVDDDNIDLFYLQMRLIADDRLSSTGFFIDLFRKRICRDPYVQEFYKLFKTTPLMEYDLKSGKLVPNVGQLDELLSKIDEMNESVAKRLGVGRKASSDSSVSQAKMFQP